jgi:hypothetical protein
LNNGRPRLNKKEIVGGNRQTHQPVDREREHAHKALQFPLQEIDLPDQEKSPTPNSNFLRFLKITEQTSLFLTSRP